MSTPRGTPLPIKCGPVALTVSFPEVTFKEKMEARPVALSKIEENIGD